MNGFRRPGRGLVGRVRRRTLVRAALVVAALVLAGTLSAERERFWETTDVTVVEIPVQVVRNGQPVTDLTIDDFELYDGKKRQQITGFEMIDLSQLDVAPGSSSASPPKAIPAMARRHFLFLFDLSFSEPASLIKARDAALELLDEGLHPSDLAAVGAYSGSRGARLLLGFTSDRNQVRLAIDTLGAPELVDRSPDALGIVFGEARKELQDLMATGAIDGDDPRVARALANLDWVKSYANAERTVQEINQRTRITALTRSFEDMASLLARVQGRKQVLYFSEGFRSDLMLGRGKDTDTAEEARLGNIWTVEGDSVYGNTGVQNDLEGMLEAFRRSDAVIQAIDIGGARAANTTQTIADVGGLRIEGDPYADRSTGQDGLFFMANETGGELFRNFNDLTNAMSKVLTRTSVTYLLSFQPKDLLPDGSYRKVRVKLRRGVQGGKLVHRPGYYAPKLWSQQTPLEQRMANADLVLGRQQGGSIQLGVTATALAPPADADSSTTTPKAMVPYVVEIGGPSLLRAHRGDLFNGEIHVYALDAHGTIHAFHNQMLGMNLTKTRVDLERTGIKFCGQLALPPGQYELRALVRNHGALTYGLETGSLTVPDFAVETAIPPIFVEPSGNWVMVSASAAGPAAPYPWTTADQVWVPVPAARLDAGERITVWLEGTGTTQASTVDGHVRAQRAEASPAQSVALQVTHRETVPGSVERVLLDFLPPQLPAGAYVLELGETNATAPHTLAFSING